MPSKLEDILTEHLPCASHQTEFCQSMLSINTPVDCAVPCIDYARFTELHVNFDSVMAETDPRSWGSAAGKCSIQTGHETDISQAL